MRERDRSRSSSTCDHRPADLPKLDWSMPNVALRAALVLAAIPSLAASQTAPRVEGRWDLKVQGSNNTTYPSWLEITHSGNRTTVGRFVGRVGSARPIARVDVEGGTIRFTIPPQWDA